MHLGIIPDGNRRWLRENNTTVDSYINKLDGYFQESFDRILNAIIENDINELSIYLLSLDNFTKRKDDTLKYVTLALELLSKYKNPRIKYNFIGEIDKLPESIKSILDKFTSSSSSSYELNVFIAICYDPIKDSVSVLNNDPLRPQQSQIDLVVRTGKEMRTSGFFPLHTLYSEWFFDPILFPEITKQYCRNIINNFKKRERRFGS